MISNIDDFENFYNAVFPRIDKNTLSAQKNNRIRIELGGNKTGKNRVKQCLFRCKKILKYCFEDHEIWLRMILWSDRERDNLKDANFQFNKAELTFERKLNEGNLLIIYKRQYSEFFCYPIVTSIINYEINREPFANITCYFINFSIPLIINIYDDRGMDIVSNNTKILKGIKEKFKDWIIYP
mgnify:CR=1 FL=1